jgi:hypothetical protein
MTAPVLHLRPFRADRRPGGVAEVVSVVDELTGMLAEAGLRAWAAELDAAGAALRAGHAAGRTRLRTLLADPEGLRIVRVGFADPAAIARWVELCDRLAELLAAPAPGSAGRGGEREGVVLPFRRRR